MGNWDVLREHFGLSVWLLILQRSKEKNLLVLSRKRGERIRCMTSDGPIFIEVVRLNGVHCRLGIEAPPEVHVLRDELPTEPEKKEGAA